MQQQTIAMRHSFRKEIAFQSLILSPFKRINYKALSILLTTTKANINNNNNSSTKTTLMGLQIDAYENKDGQNNSIIKELKDSALTTERVWVLF